MPENISDLLNTAENDYDTGQFDAAQEKLKQIIDQDPHNEQAVLKLADIYAVRGLISLVVNQYFILINIMESSGDLRRALEVCRWILKLDPENINVRMKIILLYQKLGDRQEVIRQSLGLARLLIELGQGDQSIMLLQKTQESAPENLEVGSELAEIYISYGQIQESVAQYKKIASAYLQKGLPNKSIETYKRLKLVVPEDKDIMIDLGKVYINTGQYKEAEVEFRSVLRLDLNNVEALMLLGEVCQKKGQYKDAVLAFGKVLSLDNQEVRAMEKLGELYHEQGKVKDSVKNFIDAAQNYQILGDVDNAVKIYQKILVMDPTNPVACRELTNLGAPLTSAEPEEIEVKEPEEIPEEIIASEEEIIISSTEEVPEEEPEEEKIPEQEIPEEEVPEEIIASEEEVIISVDEEKTEEPFILIEAKDEEALKKLKKEEIKVKLDKHLIKTGLIKKDKKDKTPLGLIKDRAEAGLDIKAGLISKQDREEAIRRKTGLIKGKLIPPEAMVQEEVKAEPAESVISEEKERIEFVETASELGEVIAPEEEVIVGDIEEVTVQEEVPEQISEEVIAPEEEVIVSDIEEVTVQEEVPEEEAEISPEPVEEKIPEEPAVPEEEVTVSGIEEVPEEEAVPVPAAAEIKTRKLSPKVKEKVLENIDKLLVSGKAGKAIEKCIELLKINPDDDFVRFELASIYVEIGFLDVALEILYSLKEKDKENTEYRKNILDVLKWKSAPEQVLVESRQLADIFKKQKKTPELISLYQNIILLEDDDLLTRRKLAELYLESGRKAEGVFHLENIAEEYTVKEDIDKAIDIYNRVFTESGDLSVKEKLGNLYSVLNKVNEAVAQYADLAAVYRDMKYEDQEKNILKKIIKLSPENLAARIRLSEFFAGGDSEESIDNLFKIAGILLTSGKKEPARDYLEKIVRINENFIPAYDKLVDIYFDLGDRENALKYTDIIIKTCLADKRYEDAANIYKKIIDHDPDNLSAREELSRIYILSEEKEKAVNELVHLIETLSLKKRWEEVVNIYKKLIELDDENFDFYFNLALIYLEKIRNIQDAVLNFEKAARLSPGDVKVLQYLLNAHLKMNNPGKAVEVYKVLVNIDPSFKTLEKEITGKYIEKIQNDPEDFRSQYDLGVMYKELGRLDDAIEQFQHVKKCPELLIKAYNMLALCFSQKEGMGMFDLAVRQLKKALSVEGYSRGDYLQIKYNLGTIYMDNKMYKEAESYFVQVSEEYPGYEDVKEKIKALKERNK
ncbi:MAG: tetratricopeptide repeat protein [Armatimonadota bacterium]